MDIVIVQSPLLTSVKTHFMRTLILAFTLFFTLPLLSQNVAPDFSLTDTEGAVHNLYEDYLDQGKTVFIAVGAVWSPFDEVFMEAGVLQDFQNEFVPSGNAVLLWIDPNNPTLEDFQGSGPLNLSGYDHVANSNFPLISTTEEFVEKYNIAWFPSVRMICPDRTYISDEIDSTLFYGELESAEYIAEQMFEFCGTEFNLASITGQVYHDENNDCSQDASEETNLANIKAIVDGPNGTFTRYTNDMGAMRMFAAEGDYSINLCPPNDLWSVCNNPQEVTISSVDQLENIEFGLQTDTECPRIEAQITSPILRRCFTSQVIVDYCNNGTLPADDAFLEVELDEYMTFENSVPDPSFVNGNILRYELGTVPSLECGRVHIFVYIECDTTIFGLEQCYSVTFGPSPNCDNKESDTDTECQEIRGAYDPNDKRAFPLSGSDDYTILPNEEIKYQIRFQNTGTDTAFNVFVEDVISPYLDISTFRKGQSSHPYELTIDERRKAIFRFDNIMLPDSNVNLEASNGFINYYISQKEDLDNGVHITNEAAIYFDFNEPVWTNRTDHEVDDGTSLVQETDSEIAFSLSPNPANDQLRIDIASREWKNGTVDILDLHGKKLVTKSIAQDVLILNVSELGSGLYLVHLRDQDDRCATQKLTIMK